MRVTPLAIDLFCGLGGWTEGLLAEGYYVIGFDIERHDYGTGGYPAQLVLQSVLTLHGRQFKDVALIVASPPCQEYSYMAMPWSRAKAIAEEYRSGKRDVRNLTALFDACFRIQREAIEAAGHFIPLVIENVRGACPWVGRSRWNYGPFHLWGDVPALMPFTRSAAKIPGSSLNPGPDKWNRPILANGEGTKVGGITFSGYGTPGYKAVAFNGTAQRRMLDDGSKIGGDWFNDRTPGCHAMTGSKSKARKARKAASAAIAKIPFPLASHIARYWKPTCAT